MKGYKIHESYWFIVPLVCYRFDVMVSVDEDDEVLKKRLLKAGNTGEEIDERLMNMRGCGRHSILPSTNLSVIRIASEPNKYEMMATITHEVFHAVTHFMDMIGDDLQLGVSDEAYAYLIGYLNREIFKRLEL